MPRSRPASRAAATTAASATRRSRERPFDAEEVASYEIGAKTELGERVRLNAAAFLADYTDFQSASFLGLQFLVNNAEKVRVQGLEADLTARVTDDLTLDLSATYAEATYERYTQGSCYTGRTPTIRRRARAICRAQGLPFAPKLTATAGVQWQHTFGLTVPVLAPRWHAGPASTT